MDFCDRNVRRLASKAIGDELRRARKRHGWTRAQCVALLPSGICERTLLAYEHGTRELSVLRLLELCATLDTEPAAVLRGALQRARILLNNVALHVDLRAVLDDRSPKFRPMHQWARNKLNRHTDGATELPRVAVEELADFIGCAHDELASHLARFVPDVEHQQRD